MLACFAQHFIKEEQDYLLNVYNIIIACGSHFFSCTCLYCVTLVILRVGMVYFNGTSTLDYDVKLQAAFLVDSMVKKKTLWAHMGTSEE